MSGLTYFCDIADQQRAQIDEWRASEKFLLLLALIGDGRAASSLSESS